MALSMQGFLINFFALQWVQSYIDLFGGNASQVTIAGQSAGGTRLNHMTRPLLTDF